SATVGIQNDARTDGLTVNANHPYVHGGLAVELQAGPDWLDVSPKTMVVKPGTAADLTVHFGATGLTDGDHFAALRIASNDVETPSIDVPVTLHVGSINAAFELDPNDLNRGSQGQWVEGKVTLPAGFD